MAIFLKNYTFIVIKYPSFSILCFNLIFTLILTVASLLFLFMFASFISPVFLCYIFLLSFNFL